MNQFLQTVAGLSEPARQMLRTHAGISMVQGLTGIAAAEFESVWENLAKTATSMRVADEANRPILPYAAGETLFAFRLYLEYRIRSGMENALQESIATFSVDTISAWVEHARVWAAYQKSKTDSLTEVPKLTNLKQWRSFKELLKTRLQEERNPVMGIPLAYLIREQAEVSAATVQADYPTLDDRLIACIAHQGSMYREDNKSFYSLLKQKTIEGPYWTFVEPFEASKDGRGAYLRLYSQAEGPNTVNTRVTKAYGDMQNLKFNGKSKNFTIDTYIQRHQACHNVLSDPEVNETITEKKKITDFINGISDPRLGNAITLVTSDPTRFSTFAEVTAFVAGEFHHLVKTPTDLDAFRVAAVGTTSSGSNPGAGKGGKGKKRKEPLAQTQKKKKQGKGFIPANQWKRMKPEEREAAVAKRKQEQEQRKISATSISALKPAPTSSKAPKPTPQLSVQETVAKAVSFGATEGTITLNGQEISFKVGAVSSQKATGQPDHDKGTMEELEAARAKSASSQFGRASRKQAPPRKTDQPPSLDDPIPKKPLAKPKSVKDAIEDAVIAAVDVNADPLEQPFKPSDAVHPEEGKVAPLPHSQGTRASAPSNPWVNVEQKMALSWGFTRKQLSDWLGGNDDESDGDSNSEDEDSRPGLQIVRIPWSVLAAKFPEQYKDEPGSLNPKFAPVPKQDEWVISVVQSVAQKNQYWEYAERHKGSKVHELKDPINKIRLQATRYSALKCEREFNAALGHNDQPFESDDAAQEYKELIKARKAYVTAASTGDPQACAQLCVWEEAEKGSVPLKDLQKLYQDSLARVQRKLEAYEKDPESVEEEVPNPDTKDVDEADLDGIISEDD